MIRMGIPAQLNHIPAFQHLDGAALTALLSLSRLQSLKVGDVLLYQGDLMQSFYIIQAGAVRLLHYTEDGQRMALKIYGTGDVFGLLAISGSYPHPTQIEAIQDSLIIAMDGQDARALLLDYPALALMVIDLLTAHVHEGHERVRHMGSRRVDQRLAQSLIILCAKFGKPNEQGILIDLSMTQRDLAEFTGTTVETINRTLTLWEKQGWLICSHKRLEILDHQALADLAENP